MLRVFCAFLLFTRFAPVVSGETALEISSLLEKAKGNLNQGNLGAALTLLDQIDKAKGGNSESLDLRGTIYFEQDKLAEAKKAFQTASDADPQRFPPRLHLADVLLREKAFYDARDIYTDLMEKTEIQSYNEKLRYAVLLTYLFEHNEARAKAALERITFPTESPAYYYAQAAWEFAHGRSDEGKKWTKAAGRMFDHKTIAWFARPLYDFGWTKEKPVAAVP